MPIVWDASSRGAVLPIRGDGVARRPTGKMPTEISKKLSVKDATPDVALLLTRVTTEKPEDLDEDAFAALVAVLAADAPKSAAPALVAAAKRSPEHAVISAVRAMNLHVTPSYHSPSMPAHSFSVARGDGTHADRPMVDQLAPLRGLVASLDDATYAKVREAAAKERTTTTLAGRAATSFLFPTEGAWVADDAREHLRAAGSGIVPVLILASVDDPDLAMQLAKEREMPRAVAYTLLSRMGEAAVPALLASPALGALHIVDDERVARAMAKAIGKKQTHGVAKEWFDAHPAHARLLERKTKKRGEAAFVAGALIAKATAPAKGETADLASLPPFFRREGAVPKPPAVELPLSEELGMLTIDPAERPAIMQRIREGSSFATVPSTELAALVANRANKPLDARYVLASTSKEEFRDLWNRVAPSEWDSFGSEITEWILCLLGEEALPKLRELALAGRVYGDGLLRVVAPWSAASIARGWGEVDAGKVRTLEGLLAMGPIADAAVLRDAFDGRRSIEWLRVLHRHHPEAIRAAAEAAGVADRLPALLAHGQHIPPISSGYLPKFWGTLRLETKDGRLLPTEAMAALGEALSKSRDRRDPLLAEALAACDETSLVALAEGMLGAWLAGGGANQSLWVLQAYVTLVGRPAAATLGRLARKWSQGKKAFERTKAHRVIDVLFDAVDLVGDDAIVELADLASRAGDEIIRQRAKAALDFLALSHRMSADEMDERTVPSLGLDAAGEMKLDFGPRSFVARLGPDLSPVLRTSDGAALSDLPKPGKKDDKERAAEALEQWRDFKAAARDAAAAQRDRLERAMCAQRTWSARSLRVTVIDKPLVLAVARGLVWGRLENGRWTDTFRIAEDRTLASIDDTAFTLPDDAAVGIVHAFDIEESLAARWAQILADYEIIAPFDQLRRATFRALPEGWSASTGALLGLSRAGWAMERSWNEPVEGFTRKVEGGVVSIGLSPGFSLEDIDVGARQRIHFGKGGSPAARALSEAIRDVWLAAGRPT